jgi:hypothetical protein
MTIIINEKATATAQGNHSSKHCKPVLCIDTGEIFSSATDAATHFGVTEGCISMACNGKVKTVKGKRFCFVSRTSEHLDDIVCRIRENMIAVEKAAKYDELMASQEYAAMALERAKAAVEMKESRYKRYLAKAAEAAKELQEAKQHLASLQNGTEI